MAKKRCLVLGANGFIGSHLVENLAAKGLEVTAFDRFSQAPQFSPHELITEFKGDIFSQADIASALEGVQYVFHCFSATTPFSADLDPYTDITSNILNNVHIFELCGQKGVDRVVFISSGGVIYGQVQEGHKAKETDPVMPVSPYGISKLAVERYLDYFNRKYGMLHVTYRLTNPYGPRQITKLNQGVVPSFISKIIKDQELVVYGDGSSSRDYIYIEDVAGMIADSFERAKSPIYNLGSGSQTSLKQIISALEHQLGVKAKINYVDAPGTFLKRSDVDVSRFKGEFKLEAITNLEEGLRKTIQWMKEDSKR